MFAKQFPFESSYSLVSTLAQTGYWKDFFFSDHRRSGLCSLSHQHLCVQSCPILHQPGALQRGFLRTDRDVFLWHDSLTGGAGTYGARCKPASTVLKQGMRSAWAERKHPEGRGGWGRPPHPPLCTSLKCWGVGGSPV